MSIFGSLQLDRRKKRCKSDPGPICLRSTTLQPHVPASLLRLPDEAGTAPDLLEPDVLEVKVLSKNEVRASRELPKMSRRRRKITKKLLEVLSSPFGLFLLLLAYMVLGAFMFIYIESGFALSLRMKLQATRLEYAQILVLNESCHHDVECISEWLRGWQSKMWEFPVGIIDESLNLWSFENAFHLCFSVVTTIGKIRYR